MRASMLFFRPSNSAGVVGAERFELPTLCSQSRCATRLRYAPRAPAGLRYRRFAVSANLPASNLPTAIHQLEDARGADDVDAAGAQDALGESDVLGGARHAGLADHPVALAGHVQEVDGEVNGHTHLARPEAHGAGQQA